MADGLAVALLAAEFFPDVARAAGVEGADQAVLWLRISRTTSIDTVRQPKRIEQCGVLHQWLDGLEPFSRVAVEARFSKLGGVSGDEVGVRVGHRIAIPGLKSVRGWLWCLLPTCILALEVQVGSLMPGRWRLKTGAGRKASGD